jgi:hypothetical protein
VNRRHAGGKGARAVTCACTKTVVFAHGSYSVPARLMPRVYCASHDTEAPGAVAGVHAAASGSAADVFRVAEVATAVVDDA